MKFSVNVMAAQFFLDNLKILISLNFQFLNQSTKGEVMQVTIYKCDICGKLIENKDKIVGHEEYHKDESEFIKKFPKIKDSNFWNGGYSIQRNKEWLEELKKMIVDKAKSTYSPWSYGFYRGLDDGGSWLYKWSGLVQSTCPTCYKQWDQPYHANKCNHKPIN